jgi:hypothetical protein
MWHVFLVAERKTEILNHKDDTPSADCTRRPAANSMTRSTFPPAAKWMQVSSSVV